MYQCGWARERGKEVCSNRVRRPVEEVNDAVLGWVRDEVFSEALVEATLKEIRLRVRRRSDEAEPPKAAPRK